jgi:hypothetical protein
MDCGHLLGLTGFYPPGVVIVGAPLLYPRQRFSYHNPFAPPMHHPQPVVPPGPNRRA